MVVVVIECGLICYFLVRLMRIGLLFLFYMLRVWDVIGWLIVGKLKEVVVVFL